MDLCITQSFMTPPQPLTIKYNGSFLFLLKGLYSWTPLYLYSLIRVNLILTPFWEK